MRAMHPRSVAAADERGDRADPRRSSPCRRSQPDSPQAGAGHPSAWPTTGRIATWCFRGRPRVPPRIGSRPSPAIARQRMVLSRRLPANPRAPEPPPAPAPVYRSPQAGPQAARPGMMIEATAPQAEALARQEAAARSGPGARDRGARPGLGIDAARSERRWATGCIPAKFTFDFSAPPDCIERLRRVQHQRRDRRGGRVAHRHLHRQPRGGQTVTIGGTLVLTASATSNIGLYFQAVGTMTNTTRASRLAAAITRNGTAHRRHGHLEQRHRHGAGHCPGRCGELDYAGRGAHRLHVGGRHAGRRRQRHAPQHRRLQQPLLDAVGRAAGLLRRQRSRRALGLRHGIGLGDDVAGALAGRVEDRLRGDQDRRRRAAHPAVEGRRRRDGGRAGDAGDDPRLERVRRRAARAS